MTTEPAQEGSESADATTEIPEDVQALNERLRYLEGVRREYEVTIKVVAVLTDQLLRVTGGEMVVITDTALADCPDIKAWREDQLNQVVIQVAS